MANYTSKQFKRYRQILCGAEGKKLPPCENDIKTILDKWGSEKAYYDSGISDYEKGIINFWGTSDELCDDDLGLKQLKEAADSGNAKAMNLCAMAHYLVSLQGKHRIGDEGSAEFRKIAVNYWKKGAQAKQCEALCNLAICYLEGIGIEKDLKEAKELFRKAARYGHPEARQYMKQAKLDKWKPGQEYDETPLTIQEAVRNSRPKPETKTKEQIAKEKLQEVIIKSQMMSPQKAVKHFLDEFPEFRVVQATDYEYVTAVTVLPKGLGKDDLENTDIFPRHFKINKVTRKVDVLGMTEQISAVEGKEININRLLKENDLSLIVLCKERGII